MSKGNTSTRLSRRSFMEQSSRWGGGLVLSPLALNLAACGDAAAGSSQEAPQGAGLPLSGIGPHDVLLGLYPSADVASPEDAFRGALKRLDFSWLSDGDSVLIKYAMNSPEHHPAVTAPSAIRAMVAELMDRGAGRVVVADQSGVEYVRLTENERLVGSSRANADNNGILQAIEDSGAEAHFFEEHGYADGYVEASLPEGHHWPRGMHIAKIVTQVDHIVYLPRIASHTLAGLTLAQKAAIGFLRDDSRHDVHNDAEQFYAKYTEINHVKEIRDRLRLTASMSEAVLLHSGPDTGTIHRLDPYIVVASENVVNHDALAASLLVHMNGVVDSAGLNYAKGSASTFNRFFANSSPAGPAWVSGSPSSNYTAHDFEHAITSDAALVRGWEILGTPERITLQLDGSAPNAELKAGVMQHGDGRYEMLESAAG